jgi:hypothetical protein
MHIKTRVGSSIFDVDPFPRGRSTNVPKGCWTNLSRNGSKFLLGHDLQLCLHTVVGPIEIQLKDSSAKRSKKSAGGFLQRIQNQGTSSKPSPVPTKNDKHPNQIVFENHHSCKKLQDVAGIVFVVKGVKYCKGHI